MNSVLKLQPIENQIFTIRGVQVMIDRDLAELYGVEVKRINEQCNRNIERFPETFRFQLTREEIIKLSSDASGSQIATLNNSPREKDENLKSQIATSSWDGSKSQSVTLKSQIVISSWGGARKLPYAFTEQGVAMLSAVLRSEVAVKISVRIMEAFVAMRKFMLTNADIFQRLHTVEVKQIATDKKIDDIFHSIEVRDIKPQQGIFFNGQIFDAYLFVADLIKNAQQDLILIDNYIDESVLALLSKRRANVTATIYTRKISRILQLDLDKHNAQYPPITVNLLDKTHDRFLIIDEQTVYHIGASLKDLGKKWFAFSRIDIAPQLLLERL